MIVQRLAALFRSARLTLALLFFLALLALLGTIPRAPVTGDRAFSPLKNLERFLGVRETFSSPVFIAAAVLLTANILFCTAHRYKRAGRGPALRLPDLVMHLSLVLVIAGGAVKGVAGVIRTVSVPVGSETDTIFDWKTGADVPLGFVLRVVRFETEYHPFRARIGLSKPQTAEKVGIAEVVQGHAGSAPPGGVEISFLDVDREQAQADFLVRTPEAQGRITLSLAAGPGSHAEFGGVGFTLVAYRDEVKMVRALISAVLESGLVVEKSLSPNGSVDIQGEKISLTAWGKDKFGIRFAGFQVARDPGAPLFWAGCTLLVCAIPLHFLARNRGRAGPRTDRDQGRWYSDRGDNPRRF